MFWKFGMWISRKRYLWQKLMLTNLVLFIPKERLRIFLFYDYVAVPFPHAELNRWQNNFPPCFSSSGSPVAFFDKTLVEHFLYSTSFLRIFLPRISNFTGRFQSADLKYTTLIYHILICCSLPMKLFCILSVRLRVLGGRTPQKTFVILGGVFKFFLHKIMTISERKSW